MKNILWGGLRWYFSRESSTDFFQLLSENEGILVDVVKFFQIFWTLNMTLKCTLQTLEVLVGCPVWTGHLNIFFEFFGTFGADFHELTRYYNCHSWNRKRSSPECFFLNSGRGTDRCWSEWLKPKNAHLKPIPNLYTKFKPPGSSWKSNARNKLTKWEKTTKDQITIFLKLWEDAMGLKIRNLRIKFQISTSWWNLEKRNSYFIVLMLNFSK